MITLTILSLVDKLFQSCLISFELSLAVFLYCLYPLSNNPITNKIIIITAIPALRYHGIFILLMISYTSLPFYHNILIVYLNP